jgi:hypothetical protein
MKARLFIDVQFNGRKTDAESIASAMDNVVKTGMTTLGDCWDEYGGEPKVGQFLVLDTLSAGQYAESLQGLIDGEEEDDLGEFLEPIRDFLRQIAGKK